MDNVECQQIQKNNETLNIAQRLLQYSRICGHGVNVINISLFLFLCIHVWYVIYFELFISICEKTIFHTLFILYTVYLYLTVCCLVF